MEVTGLVDTYYAYHFGKPTADVPLRNKELTLTSEQKLGGRLVTRLEYRRHFSDRPFFTRSGRPAKSQTNITFGVIYAFSRLF